MTALHIYWIKKGENMIAIHIGAGLILLGTIIMTYGIATEISRCVRPSSDEVGVVFNKSTFDGFSPGFHEVIGAETQDGKKFYAWGIVKKGE